MKDLRTSFTKGTLQITNLGFADKDNLSSNLLYFPKINFELDISGLLQGKIVINDIAFNDFSMEVPRSVHGIKEEDIIQKSSKVVETELDNKKVITEIENLIPQVNAVKEFKTKGFKTDKHIEKFRYLFLKERSYLQNQPSSKKSKARLIK